MKHDNKTTPPQTFAGFFFDSPDGYPHGFMVHCPCGVGVNIPPDRIPTQDTPHPCGNPNHWTVKYSGGKLRRAADCPALTGAPIMPPNSQAH